MIHFFRGRQNNIIAVETKQNPDQFMLKKLEWLFSKADYITKENIEGTFVGPRKEMITPWSTNAVEITQNMGISGISRIEEFFQSESDQPDYDPMLNRIYKSLGQEIFKIEVQPHPILQIDDIGEYNKQEGLALSDDEVEYLRQLSKKLERKLTDSEIFGFSQVFWGPCG